MIIVLLGASGSGKSLIESKLYHDYGYEKIISYTTRPKREVETEGIDYYFINHNAFNKLQKYDLLAEYDEYSHGRLYGTLKDDYHGDKVVVLTPNGLRQLKKNFQMDDIFSVFVCANLGTRVKRYVDRCGVSSFDFDDKNEIASRVERDYSMFLGIENEVDMIVYNNEGTEINDVVANIIGEINKRRNT